MDKIEMVDELLDSGRKLIEKLDYLKVAPETAYWELVDDLVWKLKLYSSKYFSIGAKKMYQKIQRILEEEDLAIDLTDISIVDPFDQTRKAINMMISTGDGIGNFRMTNNIVNGYLIKDIMLYRSNPA